MSNVPSPGLRGQAGARTTFRVAGVVLFGTGLVLTVVAFADLLSTMSSDSFEGPKHFWMAFVGLPLMGVGGWCLQAGFLGVASRYVAGEGAPVLKGSAAYLSDGQGILGVGRTVDDVPASVVTGPFCRACGVRNDADARFCDSCGAGLAS